MKRIQVSVSDEMFEKVNSYADKLGVPRTTFCTMAIGQYVLSYEKSVDFLNVLKDKVGDDFVSKLTVSDNK